MKLVITGNVPSKKNSRITTRSGRTFPSKNYAAWEKDALVQLSTQDWQKFDSYPVTLTCTFYLATMAGKDLDNMLSSVLDVLKDQKKRVGGKMITVREGVVEDDSWRHICPITIDAELDRANPRVEIELTSI